MAVTYLSFRACSTARVFINTDGDGRARRTEAIHGLESAHLVLATAIRMTEIGAVVLRRVLVVKAFLRESIVGKPVR